MDREMTTGEANALVSMISGVPAEQIVAFVLVTVIEAGECECGHPENHRAQKVTATVDDDLLSAGVLAQAVKDLIAVTANEKYGSQS